MGTCSTDINFKDAKEVELHTWVANKVYTPVCDVGQPRMNTRWVCTTKEVQGRRVFEARLVAKGFQDDDADVVRTDSPTYSKEGLRFVLSVIESNQWVCRSMDVQTPNILFAGSKFRQACSPES